MVPFDLSYKNPWWGSIIAGLCKNELPSKLASMTQNVKFLFYLIFIFRNTLNEWIVKEDILWSSLYHVPIERNYCKAHFFHFPFLASPRL